MTMNPILEFLNKLAANNNRPWFQAHKPEFDALRAQWLDDLGRIITAMAEWEPRIGHLTPQQATYRIYRDTRFSPDKTPYKVYFSASFNPNGDKSHSPGYYLQMDIRPGESGLYGGIWCPPSPVLNKLRRAITDNAEEWNEIASEPLLEKLYPGWVASSSLKTVPKGWDKNHPMAHILRLKDYGKFHPVDAAFFSDPSWPERTAELFRPLKPLIDFLSYSINEEV